MRYGLAALTSLFAGLSGAASAQVGQPENWQLGFQEAVTPVARQAHDFNVLLMVIIVSITLFVMGLLAYVMIRFNRKRNPTPSKTSHNTPLEIIWTTVPVIILLVIAIPSMRLLYFMDRTEEPEMTLIVYGYQWYWGYEYPDQQIPEYAAHMVPDEDIGEDQVRLLSTYDPTGRSPGVVVLPVDTNVQILITARDVLHAWAVPSFGIKRDAVPGQMNETWVRIEQEGTYYGQCSELCGANHGFMPIEVRAVSREAFNDWVLQQTAALDLEEPPQLLPIGDEAVTDTAGLQLGTTSTN